MAQKIDGDAQRFRDILKGKIRKDLKEFIVKGELIGRRGKDLISIPVPYIVPPKFRYGENVPDVGQGDGDVGDSLGSESAGKGGSGAGDSPGWHIIEVELSIEELAEMLGESLQLPRLQPRGKKNLEVARDRYIGIRPIGPESLRINRRTFKRALIRQIQSLDLEEVSSENFDIANHPIYILPEDKRYRAPKTVLEESSAAVIILMRDISGSMARHQAEIVRMEAFWIEVWLRRFYKSVAVCYIVHDTSALIVDSESFYGFTHGGGTRISSCYELCARLIRGDGVEGLAFPPAEWNIYPFHFSDGYNFGEQDNVKCRVILAERILPYVNQFSYSQVKGEEAGHSNFATELTSWFPDENVSVAVIDGKEDVLNAIKVHFSTGL